MTELENHVLKNAVKEIKAIREVLSRIYISTVNIPDTSITPELKKECNEQHKKLITYQCQLSDVEKSIQLVIDNPS